jgi:hypothetical protein
MHVVVARPGQFAAQRVRRLAGHQEHRQPRAEEVVQGIARVRGADVDVHQHRLAASGHRRVAARHVHGHVLVRTQHDLQVGASFTAPSGKLLDDRYVVRAEIREQILHARFDQAFQQVVSGGMSGHGRAAFRVSGDAKGLHR